MNPPIPISLAVEDALTESLAHRILGAIPTQYATQTIYTYQAMGPELSGDKVRADRAKKK